jgi:hypothetical protein
VLDTGLVSNAVWNSLAASHVGVGTFGLGVVNLATDVAAIGTLLTTGVLDADVRQVVGDTGAARRLFRFLEKLDTGGDLSVAASVDTGQVSNAVWNSLRSAHGDTGTFGEHLGGSLGGSASVDTGLVNNAVWNGLRADHTGAGTFGQRVLADVRAVLDDTGAAHLDQGRFGVISDSGRQAAVLDTGKVASAVWASHQTRALTSFAFDTGIWGSNAARTLTAFQFDTGIWASPTRTLTAVNDTGIIERLTAIEERTGRMQFDTGNWLQVDIRKTNNVRVIGTGDTGTADTWRAGT